MFWLNQVEFGSHRNIQKIMARVEMAFHSQDERIYIYIYHYIYPYIYFYILIDILPHMFYVE